MPLCPAAIVTLLSRHFGLDDAAADAATRYDKIVVEHMTRLLEDCILDELEITCDDDLVQLDEDDSGSDWDYEDDDDDVAPHSCPKKIRFSDFYVPIEQVEKAVEFFRSSVNGSRPLSSMTSQFRFIKNENHMQKIRDFERKGEISYVRLFTMLPSVLREGAHKSPAAIRSPR